MIKCTGKEWNAFMNDKAYWHNSNDDDHTYWDDGAVIINGEQDDYGDPAPDDAVVEIYDGAVFGKVQGAPSPSLEVYFRRWSKAQTTECIVIEFPKEARAAVLAAVAAAGAKPAK
jgi:hypothetical protein